MPTIFSKLKKALLLLSFGVLVLAVFVIDVVRGHGDIDVEFGWLSLVRNLFVLAAFVDFYFLLESMWRREQGPAKKLGLILVLMIVVGVGTGVLSLIPISGFDTKGSSIVPLGFDSIAFSNVIGLVLGAVMVISLLILRDVIFWKRRPSTRRNFLIFVGLALATAFSTLGSKPLDSSIITTLLFSLTVASVSLLAFRLSWIVYLTKREKLFCMVYGFLLFLIYIGVDVLTTDGTTVGKSLLYYSPQLKSFVFTMGLFSSIYFGMTFLITMFHLPTAEAYDRKISEVTSMHNLSRLSTQVFDFN
ncbi:MAG TPA: hypothetical protein VKS81_09085, partial [Bacteroidota bacterium]|nr:hypothetical protein [Bacteroidota bacterium]